MARSDRGFAGHATFNTKSGDSVRVGDDEEERHSREADSARGGQGLGPGSVTRGLVSRLTSQLQGRR